MATDGERSASHGATPGDATTPGEEVSPSQLSPFQRVLLATDGTVTDILAAYLGEAVSLVKLRHERAVTTCACPSLETPMGTSVLEREILLQGARSGRPLVYAASLLVPARLTGSLQEQLRTTSKPVGQLMLEERTETFREILHQRRERAGRIGPLFGLDGSAPLLARAYRIFANRRPIMLITEKFPETLFTS